MQNSRTMNDARITPGSVWFHNKRGTRYIVRSLQQSYIPMSEDGIQYVFVDRGRWYAARVQGIIDADQTFVVYVDEHDYIWVRELEEFLDGRFRELTF